MPPSSHPIRLEFHGTWASVNILAYNLCFPPIFDLISALTLPLWYPKIQARGAPSCHTSERPVYLPLAVPLPTGRGLWGQGLCPIRALSSSLVHTVGAGTLEFLPVNSVPRPCASLLPAPILLRARTGQGQGCGQNLELCLLQESLCSSKFEPCLPVIIN